MVSGWTGGRLVESGTRGRHTGWTPGERTWGKGTRGVGGSGAVLPSPGFKHFCVCAPVIGCAGPHCRAAFALAAVSGAARCWGAGFLLPRLLSLRSTGSRAQARPPWPSGSAAPRRVGSSRTRGQVLYREAAREALSSSVSVIWANLVTESCKEAILEFCAHLEASRYH